MASNLEVPFVDLTRQFIDLESDFISAFSKIGRSGSYILGPEVEQFEQAVADYCGVKHAIGVGDGSAALFLPLKALDRARGRGSNRCKFFYCIRMGHCGGRRQTRSHRCER